MAPLASVVFASGPIAPPPSSAPYPDYDFPLFKAFSAARQYAARRRGRTYFRRRAEKLFPKESPSFEVSVPLEGARDWRAHCAALIERCHSLRYSDPEGMVLAASLAVTFAERMDAGQGRSEEIADLQARTWAELGNAHRVANDLLSAEVALARALEISGRGTGDPLLLARLIDVTASLCTDQRRFEEAQYLLDLVYAIYQHLDDKHLAARALISKGISIGYALEPDKALKLLVQGISDADAARDPKLILVALLGLLWFLVDCGQVAIAAKLLLHLRDLSAVYDERSLSLRKHWLEGRIAAGLGDDARAETAFRQVREGFEAAELPYTAAMASLDLAAVWLRQGRTAEIKETVDEMVAVFRARNIQREAIGALLMLKTALQMNQATADLLQAVSAELRRLERQPALKDRTST